MQMLRQITAAVLVLAASVPAAAQKLIHHESFDYFFDNREFDVSNEKYMQSETFFAARLAPAIGLWLMDSEGTEHSLMGGVSILRDMGSGSKASDSFDEVNIWYSARRRFARRRSFEAAAGVFPRRLSNASLYSNAIWSDALRFYDASLEGLLLKYSSPCFDAELGCDWMGKWAAQARERFQIFSAAEWIPLRWLQAGWSASFYHYATSGVAHNVIDNHLLNPWLRLRAPRKLAFLDEFSLKAGLLAGYQRSREIDDAPALPLGAELVARAARRSICLQNSLYVGDDLAHYYDYPAPEGGIYGSNLYRGDNFYRGFYDRLDLIWTPRLSRRTSLTVVAGFHFDASGYLGCRQMLGFKLDI